jgi:ankyrin repeat protein
VIKRSEEEEETVRGLLETGDDVHARARDESTPLFWAAAGGQEEIFGLLVNMGGNSQTQDGVGRTPLHTAAISGHIEVVKLLMEMGAD